MRYVLEVTDVQKDEIRIALIRRHVEENLGRVLLRMQKNALDSFSVFLDDFLCCRHRG